MAITTLDQVKAVLNITGTDKDDQIEALIPMVEGDYLSIRNKAFETDDEGVIIYPVGSEMVAIRMIEFHLLGKPIQGTAGVVTSESLARYSVTYAELSKAYPATIINSIKRFAEYV